MYHYIKKYFSILTSFLHGDSDKIERLVGDINWDHFYTFLINNSLAVFMHDLCSIEVVNKKVPKNIQKHSKFLYLQQWAKNAILLQETQRIKDIFESISLDVIFLKGVLFSDRFYGSIEKRSIGDIDILVKKKDINIFHHALLKNGYTRDSLIFIHEKLCVFFTHHYAYSKPKVKLDLHWSISRHPSYRINYEQLWLTKRNWRYKDTFFTVLPEEYELVLQILSIFKDAQLGTLHAKSLLDAYVIINKISHKIDWIAFFKNRRQEGLFLISLNVIFLLSKLLIDDEFPELHHVLYKNKKLLSKLPHLYWQKDTSWHSKIRNKFWGIRLYESSAAKSFLWWATSLPFCLAVYR